MRDTVLVLGGMVMGLGLHEAAHLGWREFQEWRRRRAEGPQWFHPQSPSDARPGPAPAQHPAPMRIKGQKPAHAAARPKLRQVRWAGRVRRTKAPKKL